MAADSVASAAGHHVQTLLKRPAVYLHHHHAVGKRKHRQHKPHRNVALRQRLAYAALVDYRQIYFPFSQTGGYVIHRIRHPVRQRVHLPCPVCSRRAAYHLALQLLHAVGIPPEPLRETRVIAAVITAVDRQKLILRQRLKIIQVQRYLAKVLAPLPGLRHHHVPAVPVLENILRAIGRRRVNHRMRMPADYQIHVTARHGEYAVRRQFRTVDLIAKMRHHNSIIRHSPVLQHPGDAVGHAHSVAVHHPFIALRGNHPLRLAAHAYQRYALALIFPYGIFLRQSGHGSSREIIIGTQFHGIQTAVIVSKSLQAVVELVVARHRVVIPHAVHRPVLHLALIQREIQESLHIVARVDQQSVAFRPAYTVNQHLTPLHAATVLPPLRHNVAMGVVGVHNH